MENLTAHRGGEGHTDARVVCIHTNTHTRFLGSEINCLDRGEARIALI